MGSVLPAPPGFHHIPLSVPIRLPWSLGALILLAAATWPVSASADIAMNAPVISQQNGTWAGVPLGASPVDTVGSAGCALSSLAVPLNYYGVSERRPQ
jgi:hypothetical protein